jgi:hypothetical protein
MDNSLNSAVQKMGGNFLVAAFTPSMAFVVCVYIVFQPFIKSILGNDLEKSLSFFQSGIVLLLVSTIIGFTIYTIEIYTYKAFEGYVFILKQSSYLRNLFLKKHRRRYRKAMAKKQIVQKQLENIDSKLQNLFEYPQIGQLYAKRLNRLITQRERLSRIKYDLVADLDHNYPPSEAYIMPTRFGNILRAAELYSGRYGIDAVALWTKLVSAIPDSTGMMEKINEANNQCQFLLNGALLGIIFAFMCMIASILKGTLWWSDPSQNINDRNLTIFYLFLLFLSIAISRFFYEASLFNVEKFGEMIRTTYDLYRFNLLEALHLELPTNLEEEKKLWLKLSHFVTGNLDYQETIFLKKNTMPIEYSHPSK